MKKKIFIIALLAITITSAPRSESKDKISKPFVYSGYSAPEYKGRVKKSEYVRMSDGTQIAVDIFLPSGGPDKKSYPVVFQYTPYSRAFVLSQAPGYVKFGAKFLVGARGPVIDMYDALDFVKLLVSHGYAFVIADMRGTGASFGWKMDFMPKQGEDGAELVNWIAGQSWCDGNVGMYGGSYLGQAQLITAGNKPKALKCIFPEVVPLDGYTGEVYPGGIYLYGFMSSYAKMLNKFNLNYYHVDVGKILKASNVYEMEFSLPSAPAADEDGDGEIADEVPIDKNRDGSFLDDYKYPDDPDDQPQYTDGKPRKHLYYLATRDHLKNLDYNKWAREGKFMNGAAPQGFENINAYNMSGGGYVPGIMETGVPIYHHGGWHDGFTRGTVELFATMRKTNPSRMIIDAGFHSGFGPYWKYLGVDAKVIEKNIDVEKLRFFDRYLKNIPNGIENEPPVLIFVQNGEGWRQENEWPLARAVQTDYFLNPDNKLDESQSSPGSDEYKTDFTHSSTYGSNNGNRQMALMGIVPDKLPTRTEKDKQCLLYTSAPMNEDTEVTGHPIVNLWVSSTADYGDFYVYLEDVDEKGVSVLVTEGMLRAEWAKLYNNDEMIYSGERGISVLPDLPWHGYERDEYTDRILADGKIVELVFDLLPTSWVFKRGHSIRISIAGANWPTFELHPNLAPDNRPDNPANIVPTITVHRDAAHPSKITLPIIPGK